METWLVMESWMHHLSSRVKDLSHMSLSIDIDPVTDGELHDLYFVSRPSNPDDAGTLILSTFGFEVE
jgi:hypothetical protein